MKRTTTKQIHEVLANAMLQIVKAETYYKASGRSKPMEPDIFQENLDFLMESGCFMDFVRWHYKRSYETDEYIIEAGRPNGEADTIVIAHLRVCDGTSKKDVEEALNVAEEE